MRAGRAGSIWSRRRRASVTSMPTSTGPSRGHLIQGLIPYRPGEKYQLYYLFDATGVPRARFMQRILEEASAIVGPDGTQRRGAISLLWESALEQRISWPAVSGCSRQWAGGEQPSSRWSATGAMALSNYSRSIRACRGRHPPLSRCGSQSRCRCLPGGAGPAGGRGVVLCSRATRPAGPVPFARDAGMALHARSAQSAALPLASGLAAGGGGVRRAAGPRYRMLGVAS